MTESNPEKQAKRLRRRVFLTVSAGVFMSTMDSSLVNVALPTLMQVFATSLAVTEWVLLVYLLAITVLLVFWGRLCVHWGCGRIYSRGLILFTVGSLLCGLSPSVWFLVGFRFVQAVGASMMMATGPALIKSIYPPERLGRGLGLIGVATSLGLMTGPVVSGLLLRWVHWRAIFLVTVPVGIVFFLVGRTSLLQTGKAAQPDSQGKMTDCRGRPGRFDLTGALLWAGAVSLTLLLATHATTLCCSKDFVPSFIFHAGSVCMVLSWLLFLWHEKRCPAPMLPLELLRKRFFAMAMVSSALSFAVLFFVLILIPFYLDRILGLPSDRIGYVMMALPLSVFLVSPLAGQLHDRIGARFVATSGLLCCLVGMLLFATLDRETTALSVAFRLVLLGFGQAMFLAPNSASALGNVPDEQAGLTASLLATSRNFGMLAGTALGGLIFAVHFARETGGLDMRDFIPGATPAFLFALQRTFLYGAALSAISVIASWLRQPNGGQARERA